MVGRTNESVQLHGMIHSHRKLGELIFIILRQRRGLIQCLLNGDSQIQGSEQIHDEQAVRIEGELRDEPRAPGGKECHIKTITILSNPSEPRPIHLAKKMCGPGLEADLELRPITLRHQQYRDMFKLQEGICRGFREYLHKQEFTEIHSPKIVSSGAEGGSNIFRLDYFGRKAYLAQSPQFYKQMMVGVYERVFETGPVFRAEKHSTVRHLNEYTSLDFEMGFIDSFEEIMDMEQAMLLYLFKLIKSDYAEEISRLGVQLPSIDDIPRVTFARAKEMVAEKYNRRIRDPFDLEPEEERLIGELFKQEYDSDFVFVTHYPSKKRPFYAMDDPEDPRYTLSFDLLFRGLEITTGGQRIHNYEEQKKKMLAKGMDPEGFSDYLMIHKYGMPPHGGLGIGLERLLMMLTEKGNVRQCVLFPRDQSRLEP